MFAWREKLNWQKINSIWGEVFQWDFQIKFEFKLVPEIKKPKSFFVDVIDCVLPVVFSGSSNMLFMIDYFLMIIL